MLPAQSNQYFSVSESDVTWSPTYLDRMTNQVEEFDPSLDKSFQWVFVFQQGVDKLPAKVKHSVHTRILLRWRRPGQ